MQIDEATGSTLRDFSLSKREPRVATAASSKASETVQNEMRKLSSTLPARRTNPSPCYRQVSSRRVARECTPALPFHLPHRREAIQWSEEVIVDTSPLKTAIEQGSSPSVGQTVVKQSMETVKRIARRREVARIGFHVEGDTSKGAARNSAEYSK
ncbi:hypothetical protein [Rhizobium mongolense]|uniref:hypothetical protein n=1 Tax=Rhizobium mongolense TaxID=57676 RepID=UPI0035E40268